MDYEKFKHDMQQDVLKNLANMGIDKAKGQKIYFHKIRPPNSFSIRNMVRL